MNPTFYRLEVGADGFEIGSLARVWKHAQRARTQTIIYATSKTQPEIHWRTRGNHACPAMTRIATQNRPRKMIVPIDMRSRGNRNPQKLITSIINNAKQATMSEDLTDSFAPARGHSSKVNKAAAKTTLGTTDCSFTRLVYHTEWPVSIQSARGLAHSKTLARGIEAQDMAKLLDCGSPLPLFDHATM